MFAGEWCESVVVPRKERGILSLEIDLNDYKVCGGGRVGLGW